MAPEPSNRLGGSTSPYLLQHADNPVDWRPWGSEAFAEAASRDLPVMVSIGYSTCHWCHVMAAESFSDPVTAEQLRATAVAIKVDREELPGVDSYFMDALLAMRGQGGWPLTAFATPEGRPFFAGTYFPDEPRHGMPSFTQVLTAIAHTWGEQRERAEQIAASLHERLGRLRPLDAGLPPAADAADHPDEVPRPDPDTLVAAVEALLGAEDMDNGGFGTSPKFPPTMNLIHLLRHRDGMPVRGETRAADESYGVEGSPAVSDSAGLEDDAVSASILSSAAGAAGATTASGAAGAPDPEVPTTPDAALACVRRAFAGMASGGMRDQVAGGISRYSVDAHWHVPHFEKMLYDNALYLRAATAWHAAERELDPESRYARLARREAHDTAAFLLAELEFPEGGFAAALDADSADDRGERSEGAYYLEAELPLVSAAESAGPFVLLEAVEAADPARPRPVGMPSVREWVRAEAGTPGGAEAVGGAETTDRLGPWETTAAEEVRAALARRRASRPRPDRDEKLVSEWNGLAVTALAHASEEFAEPAWHEAAVRARDAVLRDNMTARGAEAGLGRSSTHGVAGPGSATLADTAGMLTACLTTGAPDAAHALLDQALAFVRTAESGDEARHTLLLDTVGDGIVPPAGSDPLDNSQPSGRSALAEALGLLLRTDPDASAAAIHAHGLTRLHRLLVFSVLPAAEEAARSVSWMLAEAELLVREGS